MKRRLYQVISVAMTALMMLTATPVNVMASNEGLPGIGDILTPIEQPEAGDILAPTDLPGIGDILTPTEQSDASDILTPTEQPEAGATIASENQLEAVTTPANSVENSNDDRYTELDKKLIAAGATKPNLTPLPKDDHEVQSILENAPLYQYNPDKSVSEPTFNPLESASYLPPTRNQSPYGSCWAHATVAIAEIQLIKSGLANTSINLSESQVVNNTYNSQLDPLGLSVGDNSSCPDSRGPLNAGGNVYYSSKALAQWQGAVSENNDIYKYENAASLIASGNDTAKAYASDYHVQNYFKVAIPRGDNAPGREEVKSLIKTYGAVAISYFHDTANPTPLYNDGYYYNYRDAGETNHAATIVGWDDTIPASNFNSEGNIPAGNGGWLIRNSWSVTDSTELSEFTYFWMSYYDVSLNNVGYSFVVEAASNYDNNYQYDRALNDSYYTAPEGTSGVMGANIFTAKASTSGETIKAVGFESLSVNQEYTIDVYTGITDTSNPESGTKAATVRGTTSYAGFYTVKLLDPVHVNNGDKFSIVLTLFGEGASLCCEGSLTSGYLITTAAAKPNESFFKVLTPDNRYRLQDIGAEEHNNARIKAYTDNDGGSGTPDPTPTANTVEITRPAGYDTTSLWVDGIEYKNALAGDKLKATLPDANGKIATVYKYDGSGKPAGMEVWLLSNSGSIYTATPLPEFSNLLGHAGFQAKIAGKNGIRCVSEINNNMKAALKTTGVNGFKIEELGICFMTQASRDKGLAFTTSTVGKAISKCLYRNGSGYKDVICGTSGDMKRFAASIVGVNDEKEQYIKEIAFRSYCTLSKDGQQYTIYGAPVNENMKAVVERTIATGKYAPGTSQRTMLDHILEVANQ